MSIVKGRSSLQPREERAESRSRREKTVTTGRQAEGSGKGKGRGCKEEKKTKREIESRKFYAVPSPPLAILHSTQLHSALSLLYRWTRSREGEAVASTSGAQISARLPEKPALWTADWRVSSLDHPCSEAIWGRYVAVSVRCRQGKRCRERKTNTVRTNQGRKRERGGRGKTLSNYRRGGHDEKVEKRGVGGCGCVGKKARREDERRKTRPRRVSRLAESGSGTRCKCRGFRSSSLTGRGRVRRG